MSIPQFGIPRLQPGEKCGVTRGRSRYPHALRDQFHLRFKFCFTHFQRISLIRLTLPIVSEFHYYKEPLRLLLEGAPLIKEIQIDVDKGNPLI
jgi:hypothetical protein